MAPYSAAFGAMLLSVALWVQNGWGWSALKTGLAIAPGPFLVPVTSLLFAGRLIARFGAATVDRARRRVVCRRLCLVGRGAGPGTGHGASALAGMVILGVGVGLTFPTLMGAGTASLPPSSFATGSGVINMIRQTGLALGVAMLVAILGSPHTPLERLAAFDRAWWIMAGVTLASLAPLMLLLKPKQPMPPSISPE